MSIQKLTCYALWKCEKLALSVAVKALKDETQEMNKSKHKNKKPSKQETSKGQVVVMISHRFLQALSSKAVW